MLYQNKLIKGCLIKDGFGSKGSQFTVEVMDPVGVYKDFKQEYEYTCEAMKKEIA